MIEIPVEVGCTAEDREKKLGFMDRYAIKWHARQAILTANFVHNMELSPRVFGAHNKIRFASGIIQKAERGIDGTIIIYQFV